MKSYEHLGAILVPVNQKNKSCFSPISRTIDQVSKSGINLTFTIAMLTKIPMSK